MRTFAIIKKQYKYNKVVGFAIKGFVNSDTYPSSINNDKEKYPDYYNCDIIELYNNCNIKIL
jgi:hypothetical protein